MARYNEILVGRFARSIQKLFGIKGEVPVASLGGEIVVSHLINSGRENRYLEDWKTFGARVAIGAIAAQDTVARFTNPAGTNTIAVVEGLKLFFGIAGEAFIEYSSSFQPVLPGSVTPANFDNRTNPPAAGTNGAQCALSGTNNIGQLTHFIFDDIALPANQSSNELINYDQQEITLLPGSSLQIRTLTLNIAMTVSIRWRERFLEEPERA